MCIRDRKQTGTGRNVHLSGACFDQSSVASEEPKDKIYANENECLKRKNPKY